MMSSGSSSQRTPLPDENVVITYCFLHPKKPVFKPRLIYIPKQLYCQPSQLSRELFREELLKEYKFSANMYSIEFWRPTERLLTGEHDWSKYCDVDRRLTVPLPNSFQSTLTDTSTNGLVHLIVTAEEEKKHEESNLLKRKRDENEDEEEAHEQISSSKNKRNKPSPLDSVHSDPFQKAMLILYEGLWGNKELKLVEREAPEPYLYSEATGVDIEAAEPAVSEEAKPKFFDLREILGTTDIVTTRFLIREEYHQFDDFLNSRNRSTPVLLLGQPGIGKSICLLYKLVLRLLNGQPTIYSASVDNRVLFHESGVYDIAEKKVTSLWGYELLESKGILVLFDINKGVAPETSDMGLFAPNFPTIVASSPNRDLYKAWAKQTLAERYVMKVWDWNELRFCNEFKSEYVKDDLLVGYLKYGGSVRNLFNETHEDIEALLQEAIGEINDVGMLFPLGDHQRTQASHALVQVGPLIDEDGILNRKFMSGKIPTKHIAEKLWRKRSDELSASVQQYFGRLMDGLSRSTAGLLFEAAGHRYLLKLLSTPLKIKPLSTPAQPGLVDLTHVRSLEFIENSKIGPFNNLQPRHYYQPTASNFAGMDSFALTVDGQGQPSTVVGFQFTIAESLPVSPKMFKRLWLKLEDTVKWKLVFVVPMEMVESYKEQSWQSKSDTWKDRVDQYVFGIDTKELWGTP